MPEFPFDFNNFNTNSTIWLAREHKNQQIEQDLHQSLVTTIKTENDDHRQFKGYHSGPPTQIASPTVGDLGGVVGMVIVLGLSVNETSSCGPAPRLEEYLFPRHSFIDKLK